MTDDMSEGDRIRPAAERLRLSTGRRVFLAALALTLSTAVFSLGTPFTYAAESLAKARGSEIFWSFAAAAFSSPLWVPAFLSTRSKRVFVAVRCLAAAATLIPFAYAGSVAMHQLRSYPGPSFSAGIFSIAAALAAGTGAAIVMLLFPNAAGPAGKARHSAAT